MIYRIGDLIQVIDDPVSFAVPEQLVDKIAIVVAHNENKKIYTVVDVHTNQKIRLLTYMMKLLQKIEQFEP